MAYEIKIIDQVILEIRHTGSLSIDEAKAARIEAASILSERNLKLVLADISACRISGSIINLFDFNATHYNILPVGTRIATVLSAESLDQSSIQFSETVALNRGIQLKAFFEYSRALGWLHEHRLENENELH